MINIPVLRWGSSYESLETDTVVHFDTGEELAKVSRANGGLIQRDMRKAQGARDRLREFAPAELIAMVSRLNRDVASMKTDTEATQLLLSQLRQSEAKTERKLRSAASALAKETAALDAEKRAATNLGIEARCAKARLCP